MFCVFVFQHVSMFNMFHTEVETIFPGYLGRIGKPPSISGMTSCNTPLAFDVDYLHMWVSTYCMDQNPRVRVCMCSCVHVSVDVDMCCSTDMGQGESIARIYYEFILVRVLE